MDEVLKSEIFIVVYEKKEGVLLEEFAGLFRQVHGYNFKLSNYGYSSLRTLLNDMKDLVELKAVNGQDLIRCKSPSRHHVEVSNRTNSSQGKEQIFKLSSVPLPSSGPSPGSVVKRHEQAQHTPFQQNPVKVNNINSATGKKEEKSTSKCSLPAKNIDPAVRHRNSPQPIKCGFSLNEKSAAIIKSTIPKPPTSNPAHARPSGNVAIAAGAVKTSNVSKTRRESNSKSSDPKSERNVTSMQNVKSTNTRAIESHALQTRTGPGIRPNLSYASVCANKKQFIHNAQQYTPRNIRVNVGTMVNSNSVTQSSSRAEPRTSIQSSSIIKENIQVLLNQHTDGLSVFQLQKKYLFMFRQTLNFNGSTTLKQLLLELNDVVKTEGVGVQMLVFPVHAENNPTAAANRDHDSALQGACSLFITKDFEKEVVLKPHTSDSLKTQNYKLQESAQLPLYDEQTLTSGQQHKDPTQRQNAKVIKIRHKPSTPQNMQNVKKVPSTADCVESFREELSVTASDAELFDQINENPQDKAPPSAQIHHQMYKIHGEEEFSCKTVIPKEITKNEASQNAPQDSSLPQIILHSSGFSFVMKQQINGPDTTSSFTEQKTPYHSSNMLNGPEHSQQMLSDATSSMLLQDTKPHQLSILYVENTEHFLLKPQNLMNTMQTYRQTEAPALQPKGDFQTANNCSIMEHPSSHSRDDLQSDPALEQIQKTSEIQKPNSQNRRNLEKAANSTSPKRDPKSLVINNANIFSNSSSDEKTPAVQTKNVIEKTSQEEASVSPCSNDLGKADLMNTLQIYGQTEARALQPRGDFQTANNCNIMEHPSSHSRDGLQSDPALEQIEETSEIQKSNSQNRKNLEMATNSTSPERDPESLVINNANIFSNSSSDEKTPAAQIENVIEKTSQEEASVSPFSNDLGKDDAHELYVHGAQQAAPMSSAVHQAVNIQISQGKQSKPTLPTNGLDEFTISERIAQTRQEIVDSPQNITGQPKISLAQSELQNNLQSGSEETEDLNTWQTSQQVCCIL